MIKYKKLKLILFRMLVNMYYQVIIFITKPKKRIVLASNRSSELKGNLLAIRQELEKDGETEIIECVFHFERSLKGRIKYFIKSFELVYYLATSSVFIIDDYLLPLYCVKKSKSNCVIQVWHAAGTLKRFGLSSPNNSRDIIKHHCNYDWVIVNSENDSSAYREAFQMSRKKIKALGMPKLDGILKKEKKIVEKTLLFVPTYRPDRKDFGLQFINEFIRYSEKLLPEWTINLSIHPYVKKKITLTGTSKVHIIGEKESIESYYESTEMLITDYSAALFEFSYFEQPILLYTPDLKTYKKNPGFFVDFENYLGAPFFYECESLMKYIKAGDAYSNLEYVKKIKKDIYLNNDEMGNTAKVSIFCKNKL